MRDEARGLINSGCSNETSGSSVVDRWEEISQEFPQNEREATKEKGEWRLEPEGETEMPEVKVVSEGNRKVPEGNARRQEFEEVEEVKSPKTKVIRVESEETQDYLKEARNVSHEEMDEKCYVPIAISVPQKHLFRCDNHCTEKAFSFWQFASVVKKEEE